MEYVTRDRLEAPYPLCTLPKIWFRRVEGRVRYVVKSKIDLADVKPEIFNLQRYILFYINPSKLINFCSRECLKEVHRVLNNKILRCVYLCVF
jgi:hypothetical protein